MSLLVAAKKRERRRALRVRSAVKRHKNRPRVTVFRSLKNIYVQLVDDVQGKTLASASSRTLENFSGDKRAAAREVGKAFASQVKELGVDAVVFDRGRFRYHGRVQNLAEGLREGGLTL